MNGLRFKVGEMAIVAVTARPEYLNQVVEIIGVGPFKKGHVNFGKHGLEKTARDCDYVIDLASRPLYANCDDWQLRKIDPPAEPASLTRHNEIKETA